MRVYQNGTMMQYFEWYLPDDSSLWKKLAAKAKTLSKAGITALWLPPATKSAFGCQEAGYAVYDLYDLGEFDQKGSIPTKYGTKDEYIKAIKSCHQAGIQVYADIVLDHKIGADAAEDIEATECASTNRTLPTSGEEQIKAWTVFNFPGRKGKYSDFTWNCSCFDGVDWDEKRKKNAIYLFEGHKWQNDVDSENGNYDYLMGADIDFDQAKVTEELTAWGKWFLTLTGVDGMRLDAVKHIKADFYKDWLPVMRAHTGKELFAVGEYWHADLQVLEHYLQEVNGEMSLFDVPLHYHFHEASIDGGSYDLRRIFDGTLAADNPTHAVTFVDNHDTQKGQALASPVSPWFRPHAYALILLREAGYPCVFYGDCYGIPHDDLAPVGDCLSLLLLARYNFAYGTQHDYFEDPHCIGWSREGFGLAVILSSQGDHSLTMYTGKGYANKKYVDVMNNCTSSVTIDKDGNGTFPVKDGTISVWLPEKLALRLIKNAPLL